MKKIILALVFILFSIPVNAQTHPCDLVSSTSQTINAGSHQVTFCWDGKDMLGTILTPLSFKIYQGANPVTVTATKGTTASTSGQFLYTTNAINFPKGRYLMDIGIVVDDGTGTGGTLEGKLVSPLDLTVKGALPSSPSHPRVQ